jgi:hypothetical protein
VRHAKNDDRVAKIAVIVRRRLEEWKEEDFKSKLKIIERENFDNISDLKDEL